MDRNTHIPDGFVFLARIIQEAPIWTTKPAWWFKVWAYILMKTNHKDNKLFKRGSNFFNRGKIYDDCCLMMDNVKIKSIDNVIRYLKTSEMVTTRRTTRGFIVTVLNYDRYNDADNYSNDTRNDTGTTQERHRNEPINKNVKNDKNVKKQRNIIPPKIEWIQKYCKERSNNVNPEKFFNHYESNGWKVGKNRMKDWQASVRTWEGNDNNKKGSSQKTSDYIAKRYKDAGRKDKNGQTGSY